MATDEQADEVFGIAQYLAEHGINSDNEIALRSAVSRGYYSVFLAAQRRSRNYDSNEAHGKIINECNKHLGSIRTQPLRWMRELRLAADYFQEVASPANTNTDPPHDLADWNANWKYIELWAPRVRENLKKNWRP